MSFSGKNDAESFRNFIKSVTFRVQTAPFDKITIDSADLGSVYTIPTSPGPKNIKSDPKFRKYPTNPEKYPKILGFLGFPRDPCGPVEPCSMNSQNWCDLWVEEAAPADEAFEKTDARVKLVCERCLVLATGQNPEEMLKTH